MVKSPSAKIGLRCLRESNGALACRMELAQALVKIRPPAVRHHCLGTFHTRSTARHIIKDHLIFAVCIRLIPRRLLKVAVDRLQNIAFDYRHVLDAIGY